MVFRLLLEQMTYMVDNYKNQVNSEKSAFIVVRNLFLETACNIFSKFGFKKTMDEIARAGLSTKRRALSTITSGAKSRSLWALLRKKAD
jgi:hypothetical protein